MEYNLFKGIIELSVNKQWELAKKEWYVKEIILESNGKCLCGKYPIRERVYIHNQNNLNKALVGNCCINKFFEDSKYNKVFNALKKNKLNKILIEKSYEEQIIIPTEYIFLIDVYRKRSLSLKQQNWFNSLKRRIINYYTNVKS